VISAAIGQGPKYFDSNCVPGIDASGMLVEGYGGAINQTKKFINLSNAFVLLAATSFSHWLLLLYIWQINQYHLKPSSIIRYGIQSFCILG